MLLSNAVRPWGKDYRFLKVPLPSCRSVGRRLQISTDPVSCLTGSPEPTLASQGSELKLDRLQASHITQLPITYLLSVPPLGP